VTGVVAYGAYIPHNRLRASEIESVLGSGGGSDSRAVASYDEDTSSMAVEAARAALRGLPGAVSPSRVLLATTTPPYVDRSNAALVHAALGLPHDVLAVDVGGAPRSAVGALLAAADAPGHALALLSDVRTGLPGGADERSGGDAAGAVLFGPGSADAPVLAELVSTSSVTDEFLDRWRIPGDPSSRVWEERFSDYVYGPLAVESFGAALKQADVAPDEVDHLIVSGLATKAVRQFARSSGVRKEALAPDLTKAIGNSGTAQPAVLLADVLDRALPGQTIVLVLLADGATTLVLRTTDAIGQDRRSGAPTVAEQLAGGDDTLSYATYLTWRGMLRREPPRRPEPDAPAAPPTHRAEGWKYSFRGSRCDECATVNLPPNRVCYECGTTDRMTPVPMADVPATVATYTVDRLAFTPSPPMTAVVVDFKGGGRFRCELTDAGPDLAIGDAVEMTFRKLLTADGVHNYFWKARPARIRTEES
jgi:3-hydroxy-3-methylglutaryl CoA synthase